MLLTLRSPEILAPARMPVAEGKKMENIPKKLPSGPRQSGTKFWTKMSPGRAGPESGLPHLAGPGREGRACPWQLLAVEPGSRPPVPVPIGGAPSRTPVAEEAPGGLVLGRGDQGPHQVVGEGDHDDHEEEHLGLGQRTQRSEGLAPPLEGTPAGRACSRSLSLSLSLPLTLSFIHSFTHSSSRCRLSSRT